MIWIYFIIVLVILFSVAMYFFQFLMTRNLNKATGHLQSLSKDYLSKEEEANRILQNAQKEAKSLLAKEAQTAKEAKDKLIKDAQEEQQVILREANQRSAEIADKAKRNAEFVLSEIDKRIDERAKEKVNELIQSSIPKEFLQNVHEQWISQAEKGDFDFKHLKVPEKVEEVKIISAFPLTDSQQASFKKKLKSKVGIDITLKAEVDPSLIAGVMMVIGSVVVDASLKCKIQKAI